MENNLNNDNELKKVLSIVAISTVTLTGFLKYVTVGNLIPLNTYEVKGFALTVFGLSLLVYSISTKKKILQYIAYLITMAGYGYNFYTIFTNYDELIHLEIGFYLYAISAATSLISFFIPEQKTISNPQQEQEVINKINANANNYIIGTYLYGLNEQTIFSNHRCALATVPTTSSLIIILISDKTTNVEIQYNQIEKIIVKKSLSIHKNTEDPNKCAEEDRMLSYALGGSLGLIINDNSTNIDANGEVNLSASYLAELYCKINNISKKVVIVFDKDPEHFFQVFGTLYEKNSE